MHKGTDPVDFLFEKGLVAIGGAPPGFADLRVPTVSTDPKTGVRRFWLQLGGWVEVSRKEFLEEVNND